MRGTIPLLFLFAQVLATTPAQTPQAQNSPAQPGPLTGRWIILAEYLGTPVNASLELTQEGNKLTGNLQGDKLEGSVTGNAIHFLAKDDQGGTEECAATVTGGTMSGTMIWVDGVNPSHPLNVPFTARLAGPRPASSPKTHEFTPTVFYRQFSSSNEPVLTVNPGDTIHTTTVDAGGNDEKGVPRVMGGNPETGPFYVESAEPGDTLLIHLVRVRLNRDWAISDDAIVERALDSDLAVKMKDGGKTVRWHLDMDRGVASPEKPGEHLQHYSVPLKPMMGCIAVAPGLTQAPPPTGDSGNWGGNMDFNEIVEGATVFLPVRVTGALLYIGDGHAAQSDGELNGNALETSMDVTFTVDVISGKRIPGPRVESPTRVMAVGLGGSLEDALRDATSNMADLLTSDYKLTPSEIAQVLGSAAELKISEVADRNVGVILKLDKERLELLTSPSK
jgi:acetamidase/formamidase